MDNSIMELELKLPGFRFHPTEEELVNFYLKNTVLGKRWRFEVITFLDIYRHDPWHLPELAKIEGREWYFFVSRNTRHGHGGRSNRTTVSGFWKATGLDRPVRCVQDPRKIIGLKKTLVFYRGRAPRGCKTDWIMNEYRLPDPCTSDYKENVVLCKIYRKATSLRALEKRAAKEMDDEPKVSPDCLTATISTFRGPTLFSGFDFAPENFGIPISEIETNATPFRAEEDGGEGRHQSCSFPAVSDGSTNNIICQSLDIELDHGPILQQNHNQSWPIISMDSFLADTYGHLMPI